MMTSTLQPDAWIQPDAWEDGDIRWRDVSDKPKDGYVPAVRVPYCAPHPYETEHLLESNAEAWGDITIESEHADTHVRYDQDGTPYVRADCPCDLIRDAIRRLESYPALDEDDWSSREWDGAMEDWDDWGRGEAISAIERHHDVDLGTVELDELNTFLASDDVMAWGWDRDHAILCETTCQGLSMTVRPERIDRSELLKLGAEDLTDR